MNKDFKDIFFSGRHYSFTHNITDIPNEIRPKIKYLLIYDVKTKKYKKFKM